MGIEEKDEDFVYWNNVTQQHITRSNTLSSTETGAGWVVGVGLLGFVLGWGVEGPASLQVFLV